MAVTPFEHAGQARLALRAVVAEHGPELLSRPRELANLLADLLPEAPRIARVLVTAAQDQVADELREHTAAGMDATTASRMVASSFANATMLAPDACAWVVGEFALALGLIPDPDIRPGKSEALHAATGAPDIPTAPISTEPASIDGGRPEHARLGPAKPPRGRATPAPGGRAAPARGRPTPPRGRVTPARGRATPPRGHGAPLRGHPTPPFGTQPDQQAP